MKVTIIGLGLIGGSMALSLRKTGFATELIGVDTQAEHIQIALERQLIDRVLPLQEALALSDLVILAVPVDVAASLVLPILDQISPKAILTDVGSTKLSICTQTTLHPKRGRFVAGHPIAGTEYAGPQAALEGLFKDKVSILCETELSDLDALQTIQRMYEALEMQWIEMNAEEHDKHLAYVSHLSHITSFTLALTVLKVEQDEKDIFRLAGSGFASTARLAKSSAQMWLPIFMENRINILSVLDEYMQQLAHFRESIAKNQTDDLKAMMQKANNIKDILAGI
jgi:prephenate dehydrogenase